MLERPTKCRPQIIVLAFQTIQPRYLVRFPFLSQPEKESKMPIADCRFFLPLQLLQGIFAHCLQHCEARLAMQVVLLEQTLVNQRLDGAKHIRDAVWVANRSDRFERRAAHEYREPPEQRLLVSAEQVVAPADRGAQRLVPRRQVTRRAAEHV